MAEKSEGGWIMAVHITQRDIRYLSPKEKSYKRGCGNGLFIWVTNTYKGSDNKKYGGKKYFKGRYKDSETHVGVFGNGYGEMDLSTAQSKWNDIKEWSRSSGQKVSQYKSHQQKKIDQEQKTFGDAVYGFLKDKQADIKPFTHHTYKNQLENHVLSNLSHMTPLHELEWDNGGRNRIKTLVEKIKINANGHGVEQSRRCENLLSQTFKFAISQGWMARGQNPVDEDRKRKSSEKRVEHHPTLSWNDVPKLIEDINLNRSNSHIQSVLATKFLLMTFLRTGALVRLEWEMIKNVDGVKCFVIDGKTSGLKRKHGINDHIPHHVPITKQMDKLLSRLKALSDGKKYVFQPIMASRFDHLTPEAINDYLVRLGYKNKQRAHGWRRTARTNFVDILGCDRDIIKRQMGHLPDNKVDQAYDQSLRLKERHHYLQKWSDLLEENGLEV